MSFPSSRLRALYASLRATTTLGVHRYCGREGLVVENLLSLPTLTRACRAWVFESLFSFLEAIGYARKTSDNLVWLGSQLPWPLSFVSLLSSSDMFNSFSGALSTGAVLLFIGQRS